VSTQYRAYCISQVDQDASCPKSGSGSGSKSGFRFQLRSRFRFRSGASDRSCRGREPPPLHRVTPCPRG